MYTEKQLLHIVLFSSYLTFIICVLFLYIVVYFKNDYNYYIKNKYLNILIFISFGVLLNSIDLLIEFSETNNQKLLLLKFNIVYIIDIPSIIIYSYRGIRCYLDCNHKNRLFGNYEKIYKKLVYFILFIYLLFVIILNFIYRNTTIKITDWQYYPYYIMVLIFIMLHPFIIYILNNIDNNIRNDFIISFIVIFINFFIFMLSIYFQYDINILLIFKPYWSIICSFIIYLICLVIPLLNIIKKRKNVKNEHCENHVDINMYTDFSKDIYTLKKMRNISQPTTNDEIKEIYDNYIINFKNIEGFEKIVDDIEKKIEINDIKNIDLDYFILKLTERIYINIYEYNINV